MLLWNFGTAVNLGIIQEQTATATKKGSAVGGGGMAEREIYDKSTGDETQAQTLDKKQKKKKKTREDESESQGPVHKKT